MSASALPSISVAHLRQNPTIMLRRVQAGETYVVTSHGVPVAKVSPVDQPRWLPVGAVADLLGMPDTTGWADDLRRARAATEPRDPWAR